MPESVKVTLVFALLAKFFLLAATEEVCEAFSVVQDGLASLDVETCSNEKWLILLGGPSASGKGTVQRTVEEVMARTKNSVRIDPDDIMVNLPSYRPGLCGASNAHRDAALIANYMLNEAIASGKNVTYDRTMSSPQQAIAVIENAFAHGYHVTMVGVSTDLLQCAERAKNRCEENGRCIPLAVLFMSYVEFSANFMRYADTVNDTILVDNNGNAVTILRGEHVSDWLSFANFTKSPLWQFDAFRNALPSETRDFYDGLQKECAEGVYRFREYSSPVDFQTINFVVPPTKAEYSQAKEVARKQCEDAGETVFMGRTLRCKSSSGRVHSWKRPWVYDGWAIDVGTGIEKESRNWLSKTGAKQHAFLELSAILEKRGLVPVPK